MKVHSILLLAAIAFLLIGSCKNKPAENTEEIIVPKASVSVTRIKKGNIENWITLNGRTVFYKKNQVVAPISGYITAVHVKFGDKVEMGKVLFEIQTRENRALEQSGNESKMPGDMGIISVASTTDGIINEPLQLGEGAYVCEGSTLCTIADNNDLQVLVNVPFELHSVVSPGIKCRLLLPDNSQFTGTVTAIRPFVEENSQTQEVLVKPSGNINWPENMNLSVTFLKENKDETLLVPKAALLTNETQSEFWVMKIVNDSLAIQVPVETGLKNDSLVELVSTGLTPDDIIILEGGYGLEDSSLVNIIRKP